MLDWLWNNREWIFSGVGVSAFASVVWIIRKLLFSHKAEDACVTFTQSPAANQEPSTSTSANATTGPISINVWAPLHSTNARSTALPPANSAAEATPEMKPDIRILGSQEARIAFADGFKWIKDSSNDGVASILVRVENTAAEPGKRVPPAKRLVGSMKFYNQRGELLHHVSRGYWINHANNYIDLLSGGSAAAILGVCEGNLIHTYENLSERQMRTLDRPPEWLPPDPPEADDLSFELPIDVLFIVISEETCETLAQSRFRLTPTDSGCSILRYE